jgi:hypothetical protein
MLYRGSPTPTPTAYRGLPAHTLTALSGILPDLGRLDDTQAARQEADLHCYSGHSSQLTLATSPRTTDIAGGPYDTQNRGICAPPPAWPTGL